MKKTITVIQLIIVLFTAKTDYSFDLFRVNGWNGEV